MLLKEFNAISTLVISDIGFLTRQASKPKMMLLIQYLQ